MTIAKRSRRSTSPKPPQILPAARPDRRLTRGSRTQKREKSLYGLIKPSKLETLHFLGSFTIALFSVAAVLYVMTTVIVSGGVA